MQNIKPVQGCTCFIFVNFPPFKVFFFSQETCRLLHRKPVTNNCADIFFFLLRSWSVKKWCCIFEFNV